MPTVPGPRKGRVDHYWSPTKRRDILRAMACNGCNCGPPDPIQGSREGWRLFLFLLALGGVLVFVSSR